MSIGMFNMCSYIHCMLDLLVRSVGYVQSVFLIPKVRYVRSDMRME